MIKEAVENRQRTLTRILLFGAFLFGTFVRIAPVWQAGFPLNDGGLFYAMTADLQRAGYILPAVTTYNQLGIPFAYPPLPFYLAALTQALSGASLLQVVRWLPVVFSLLCLPAFYLLARSLLEEALPAALATLLYALLPRSYEWTIMGGGVTRAPAALFLILLAWAAYRLFRQGGWVNLLFTIFSGALVVLMHPERALHAAATAALLWLYFGRSRAGVRRAAGAALGVLLLTAPWWATALIRYGWTPFALAFQSGGQRWLFWSPLLLLNFTDEQIALVALLAVIGVIACLLCRKTFLPAWLALAFLVDPRSAPHVVPIQVCLLGALGLSEVILPALARLGGQASQPEDWRAFLAGRKGFGVLGYLFLVMLINAILNLQSLETLVLSNADRSALSWVASQTPSDSRFLVLGWQENAMLSPLLEWFPALSGRNNLTTMQGREWLPGKQHFQSRLDAYPELYACMYQDATCLERWALAQGSPFDYVYLSLVPVSSQTPQGSALEDSLLQSKGYQLVYKTPAVLIFARR